MTPAAGHTVRLGTALWRDVVVASARHAGLPGLAEYDGGLVLEAVCLTESSGNPRARHWDPEIDPNCVDDGDYEVHASYGLFQIEGLTALALVGVSRDTRMDFTWLYRPLVNIALGTRVLVESLEAFGGADRSMAAALAAYNGGAWGARVSAAGRLNDQAYVDRVLINAARVAVDRHAG